MLHAVRGLGADAGGEAKLRGTAPLDRDDVSGWWERAAAAGGTAAAAGDAAALQAVLAAALLAATAQGACAPCATAPRPQPFRGAVHTLQRTASTPLALSLSPPADNWRDSVAASC